MMYRNVLIKSSNSFFDDVNNFWQLIAEARVQSNDCKKKQLSIMHERLIAKEVIDLVRWHQYIEGFSLIANKNKLWAASEILNRHNSEDGFDYFKLWLIAQGRMVYRNALINPDSLADVICGVNDCVFEFEELFDVDYSCYFAKNGIMIPDVNDYEKYLEVVASVPLSKEQVYKLYESIDFSEEMNKDIDLENDDLKEMFPKLTSRNSRNEISDARI